MSKRPAPDHGLEANGEPPSSKIKLEHTHNGLETASDEDGRRSSRKTAPRRAIKHEKLPTIMYKPGETLKGLGRHGGEGQRFEVRIPPSWMSNANQQVRARQLWGSDVYTEDSDLVASLMHAGFYSIALPQCPPSVAEVRAVVALLPPMPHYPSTSRHSIRSRAWGASLQGCSFKVERAWLVTVSGAAVELEAGLEGAPPVAPTFAPIGQERVMTTRAAASAVDRRQRMMQEVTVQYNLCNEPWVKYSMAGVADRGLTPKLWTSARLHHSVLYVETHRNRYELSRLEVAEGAHDKEVYRWAQCATPLPAAVTRALGSPLPEAQLVDAQQPLSWSDFQWGPTGVYVKGKFYALARLQFVRRHQAKTGATAAASQEPAAAPMLGARKAVEAA